VAADLGLFVLGFLLGVATHRLIVHLERKA
jgi:hypothetical protein